MLFCTTYSYVLTIDCMYIFLDALNELYMQPKCDGLMYQQIPHANWCPWQSLLLYIITSKSKELRHFGFKSFFGNDMELLNVL